MNVKVFQVVLFFAFFLTLFLLQSQTFHIFPFFLDFCSATTQTSSPLFVSLNLSPRFPWASYRPWLKKREHWVNVSLLFSNSRTDFLRKKKVLRTKRGKNQKEEREEKVNNFPFFSFAFSPHFRLLNSFFLFPSSFFAFLQTTNVNLWFERAANSAFFALFFVASFFQKRLCFFASGDRSNEKNPKNVGFFCTFFLRFRWSHNINVTVSDSFCHTRIAPERRVEAFSLLFFVDPKTSIHTLGFSCSCLSHFSHIPLNYLPPQAREGISRERFCETARFQNRKRTRDMRK